MGDRVLCSDQLHPVAELDGSGALVARFAWASNKNTPDLMVSGGVTYRVFTDQVGSPRAVVNAATGAVAGVLRHDAWGVVLEDSVSALMPFGFAGGLYDAETGLVRFGAREYDASIGRWVMKDPIGFGSGTANLYAYALNDAINFVDRNGEAPHVGDDRCDNCISDAEGAAETCETNCLRKHPPPAECAGGRDDQLKACKRECDKRFKAAFDRCSKGPCSAEGIERNRRERERDRRGPKPVPAGNP